MHSDTIAGLVLVDLALVILLGRMLAPLASRLGQPPVMAEIFVGIALGPSLFGALAPGAAAALFPPEATQMLAAIGSIGLVLFMFFVGLELDLGATLREGRVVSFTAFGAIAAPAVCGAILGGALYASHSSALAGPVSHAGFVLFICVAVSISAFPVLARILHEHGISSSRLGRAAMSTAAVNDLVGWLLLIIALAVATGGTPAIVLAQLAGVVVLVLVLVLVVQPLLRLGLEGGRPDPESHSRLAFVLAILTASAGFTQLIGLHAVIGAFLFGAAFPSDLRPRFLAFFRKFLLPMTMSLLLPIYFLGPGLNFDLGALEPGGGVEIALIVAVAFGGKLLGTLAGARSAGMPLSESTLLGILLNTRGLMELVVLNIGFTEGLLDKALYSEFLVMALLATLLTSPILRAALRGGAVIKVDPTFRSSSGTRIADG
jgi:K+:H+ antiporter